MMATRHYLLLVGIKIFSLMTHNILTGISKYSRAEKVAKGAAVKDAMSIETTFPTLASQTTAYIEAYDDFVQSIPAPNVRNQMNDAICESKTVIFRMHYTSLGNFVRGVAMGNEDLLRSSGYDMKQKPSSWPVPQIPMGVDTKATNDLGVLMVICESEDFVGSYIARVSVDKMNWIENFSFKTKVYLKNVPLGQILYVQMQTKNSTGRSAWSKILETRLPAENEPVIKMANVSVENI